jgi:hypothetical protein
MKGIAVIGWGSLKWDQGCLRLADGKWYEDGPQLPVEFARVSDNGKGRLTLVITDSAPPQKTLWAFSAEDTIEGARENLRKREKTPNINDIGYWPTGSAPESEIERTIAKWCVVSRPERVIWTALPPKDKDGKERVMTADEAITYLRSLPDSVKEKAREYIEKAPKQIDTPIRRRIENEFGWYPK